MRAILATILLCIAVAAGAQAEPSAETIARGKALTDAADCAGCHTADPVKPFGSSVSFMAWAEVVMVPRVTSDAACSVEDTIVLATTIPDSFSSVAIGT